MKTTDLEKLGSQSTKQLDMGKSSVSMDNAPKIRLATSCVSNEIQVGKVLVIGHWIRLESVTKRIREIEVVILHQSGKTSVDSALLGQLGNNGRTPTVYTAFQFFDSM